MYWIDFNNIKNKDLDVEVVKRPNVPIAEKRVTQVEIAGRDGVLTLSDGSYKNRTIEVAMNFIVNRSDSFMNKTRAISNWLTGPGILRCSDDTDGFYKVSNAFVRGDIERTMKRAGFFTASFDSDPFFYFDSGTLLQDADKVKLNPYHVAEPIYYISGTGACVLNVNGNTLPTNVVSDLVIDTGLMMTRHINGDPASATTRFDYSKFVLNSGLNDISITGGFVLKIQPNWRTL